MRWFYVLLFAWMAWGGFLQVAVKDQPQVWQKWEEPR